MADGSLGEGAPFGSGRKRGEQAQAVGRSRGGRTTKVHAIADERGRPRALLVTGGRAHDLPVALTMLEAVVNPPRTFLADANYDTQSLRSALARRGVTAIIPNRGYRRTPFSFDPVAYTQRNLVERMFCRLKDWRRIATRYDKLARNYHAGLCLASILTCWLN